MPIVNRQYASLTPCAVCGRRRNVIEVEQEISSTLVGTILLKVKRCLEGSHESEAHVDVQETRLMHRHRIETKRAAQVRHYKTGGR